MKGSAGAGRADQGREDQFDGRCRYAPVCFPFFGVLDWKGYGLILEKL